MSDKSGSKIGIKKVYRKFTSTSSKRENKEQSCSKPEFSVTKSSSSNKNDCSEKKPKKTSKRPSHSQAGT